LLAASTSVPDISTGEVALRLVVAAALGAAVGLERELREREAGLRTHMLVSLGSALFTLASAYGFNEFLVNGGAVVRADPTRIAAQIVTGIGFIGAGAIIRQGGSVRGVTTAATLWVVAAIGLATGAGYWEAAILTTGLVVLALGPLRLIAYRLLERFRPDERRIVVALAANAPASRLLEAIESRGYDVRSFDVERQPEGRFVTLDLDRDVAPLAADLSDEEYVTAVRWGD
jgi:putative Mg2+ transporter-C (MgtC) family protein